MNEKIEKLLKQLAAGESVYEGPKVGPTPNQLDFTPGLTLEQSSTISVPYMDENGEWSESYLPLVIANMQGKDELKMLRLIFSQQIADQKERLNAHIVEPTGVSNNSFETPQITEAQDLGAFGESMRIQAVRESAPSENGEYTLQDLPIKGDGVVYVNNLIIPSVEFSGTDGVDGNVTFTFSKDQPVEDAEIAVFAHSIEATESFKKHIAGCEEAIKKIADNLTSTGDEFDNYQAAQKEDMSKIAKELDEVEEQLKEAKNSLAEDEEGYDGANTETSITEFFNAVRKSMENVYEISAQKAKLEADKKAIEGDLDIALAGYQKFEEASNEATATAEDSKSDSQQRLADIKQWIDGEEGAA